MDKQKRIARPKIKQATKVRSILQQDINSICPFCENREVGHFEIHHIDENRENNDLSNLILLCPNCHSKITKGDITQENVYKIKKNLLDKKIIECVSITIDSKNCSWENFDEIENAFIQKKSAKQPFPILNFSLINHTNKLVLLKEIELKAKHLQSGLSGIPNPYILKPIIKFRLKLPDENEKTIFNLDDEIAIPSEQAVKFQIQLFKNWNHQDYPIDGRKVLYFEFKFHQGIALTLPTIFFNCKSENEKLQIIRLS